MKWVGAILLCLFLLILEVISLASEPDGFNGMKWGTSLKEFQEKGLVFDDTLTKKKDRDGTEIDEISGRSFLLGDIEFDWVKYSFYKNKFFEASAFFSPAEFANESYLLGVLKGKYGSPTIDTTYYFVNEEGKREIDCFMYNPDDPKNPERHRLTRLPLEVALTVEVDYFWDFPTTRIYMSVERHVLKSWIRPEGYINYRYKPKIKETFDKL
jgi:hypothetical protein